jgi:hypothetical protein
MAMAEAGSKPDHFPPNPVRDRILIAAGIISALALLLSNTEGLVKAAASAWEVASEPFSIGSTSKKPKDCAIADDFLKCMEENK